MPVPVSVTHPKGAGIQGANNNTLQTEGPFARIAKLKAEQEQQQQQQQQQQEQQAQQQPPVNGHDKQKDVEQQSAAAGVTEHSIAVRHLDFAYPGLGEHAMSRHCFCGSHSCWYISFVLGGCATTMAWWHHVELSAVKPGHCLYACTQLTASCAFAFCCIISEVVASCSQQACLQAPPLLPFLLTLQRMHCLLLPYADGRPIAGRPPLITDMCLELQPGSRCLLIGANGAGKTTLLKILAGKHMVSREQVRLQQGLNSQQLWECCSAASIFEASSSLLIFGSLVCIRSRASQCMAL
jgi:ABC-type multidrug transport system fused ATPase/permease subunit